MDTLEKRVLEAEALWQLGGAAEAQGDYETAYRLYTEAHELVVDCARLHQKAHERLRVVNLKLGNYGECLTDWLLHLFAPLGVFELVAYFSKTEGSGAGMCRRRVRT